MIFAVDGPDTVTQVIIGTDIEPAKTLYQVVAAPRKMHSASLAPNADDDWAVVFRSDSTTGLRIEVYVSARRYA